MESASNSIPYFKLSSSLTSVLFHASLLSLTSILFHASLMSCHGQESLSLGYSSASPESNQTVLNSTDGTFSAGFHSVGTNAFGFAIWYSNTPESPTLVWMANRDQPLNGKNSRLHLQKDGDLVLFNADGRVTWRTDTRGLPVTKVALLDTGNLVLRTSSGKIVWQSFDSPTDTLLPGQQFCNNAQLFSRLDNLTYKSGYHRFYFNDENYLALVYQGSNLSSKYWPKPWLSSFDNGRTTYNISRTAVLDELGGFTASDQFSFNASDYGIGPKRRLTMDVDGNLRLYSLDGKRNSWIITWTAVAEQCRVHGLCGLNGVCIYTPEPKCVCPPGYERADSADWFKGCRQIKKLISCNPNSFKLLKLPYTDFYGFDSREYTYAVSFEKCRETCINDCDCVAFGYRFIGTGQCYPKTLLISGYQSPGVKNDMYLKISVSDSSVTNDSWLSILKLPDSPQCSLSQALAPAVQPNVSLATGPKKRKRNQLIIPMATFVSAIAIVEIVCIALGWWFIFRNFDDANLYSRQGYFAVPTGLKKFTFAELKEATHNFKDIVGKGGFGTVYKGCLLPENKVVAVKRLEGVSQGEDEFWAEVSMIGRVNHINLVRMFGFCAEGKHRLLVFEYVENGSLDKHIFTQNSSMILDWKKRLQIAVGTAKGLAYLQEECLEWILHCDVKPQNILLDEQFRAKVSDFGLAKLVDSGQGRDRALNFSTIRGTRGYLAPEWTMNLPITAKADVYSFGILLLELVSGREAAKFNVGGSSVNFVQWACENVRGGGWMVTVVDTKMAVAGNEEKEMERVLKMAVACVEQDRDRRPSMSELVEMLMAE
ncbi:putative receptor protein kinase ZmPK1 [Cryptomeria japonica]|uniref:putative receptor protein kinase ZmPK1 n=1 Tax=Cryptomeria japonica TaxID=3369 RepID=UPI0027DA37AB|nr:putative receptor protein kinase ZmPK1 [Cryptomeria japonica]